MRLLLIILLFAGCTKMEITGNPKIETGIPVRKEYLPEDWWNNKPFQIGLYGMPEVPKGVYFIWGGDAVGPVVFFTNNIERIKIK